MRLNQCVPCLYDEFLSPLLCFLQLSLSINDSKTLTTLEYLVVKAEAQWEPVQSVLCLYLLEKKCFLNSDAYS